MDYLKMKSSPLEINSILKRSIIKSLCKDKKLKVEPFNYKVNLYKGHLCDLEYSSKKAIQYRDYSSEIIDFNNMQLKCYPHFGIYIFKCDNFYLSVMAGEIGENGNGGLVHGNKGGLTHGNMGGHGHNDKLSFELNLSGIDIYIDSGTYLYTSLPELRNEFRSVKAHNIPIIDGEEQCFFTGTFSMENKIRCEVLRCSKDHLVLYLTYRAS